MVRLVSSAVLCLARQPRLGLGWASSESTRHVPARLVEDGMASSNSHLQATMPFAPRRKVARHVPEKPIAKRKDRQSKTSTKVPKADSPPALHDGDSRYVV